MTKRKLDRLTNNLVSDISLALDVTCPIFKADTKVVANRWYSPKHAKLNEKVQKQYKLHKRFKGQESTKYFELLSKYRRACKRAKKKVWRKYVSDTPSETDMSHLSQLIQHRQKNRLNFLEQADGSGLTSTGTATILELAKKHFPQATPAPTHETYNVLRKIASTELSLKYPDYVTPDLVKRSLRKFKPYKAPGPDGFKPVIFKHFPDVMFERISFIYKACFHFHYTPLLWRETWVVFIPKPGKSSYRQASSFRPICLSNYLVKGLERLFVWHMEGKLVYYPIHAKQHGFQKGKGTEVAISNSINVLEGYVFRGQKAVGMFLDISSAYDSVDIHHIRTSLYLHGGDDDPVEWYFHLLGHRILDIHLHGDSVRLQNAVGFPQGGVASAMFWLIAFDPAVRIINTRFVEGNAYADDCAVIFGGPSYPRIIHRLQLVMDDLVAWGRTCGLRFNPEKTVAVAFSRSRQLCEDQVTIDDQPIQFSDTVRYLGVFLDKKLHWTFHIDTKIAKAKKFLMHAASISNKTWGTKPSLMKWTWECVVRPALVYGSVAWGHESQRSDNKIKLRSLNRLGQSTYSAFPPSVPSRATEILRHFPSPSLHFERRTLRLCQTALTTST